MKVFLTLLFIYSIILLLASLAQRSLIFHPQKLRDDYSYRNPYKNAEEIFVTTADHEKINGLFFTAKSDKVILYFHGNAGSLASWQEVYHDFHTLGYNFLIIDYRGYGKSTGSISEKGLYADGQAAYDFLLRKGFQKQNIVLYGRSMGTGIAVEIAQRAGTLKALILESPFISMKKLAKEKVPYLFPSLILRYEFNNKEKITHLQSPLLIIHGTRDDLILFKHGEDLFNHYHHPKQFLKIENGTHNDLSDFPEFARGVRLFLSGLDKGIF